MLRATSYIRAGAASGVPFDTVTLDAGERHLRRKLITLSGRGEVLVDFPLAVRLEGGDCLVLEDGRLVEVVAATEDLHEAKGRDARHLAKLAWHIGNRHLEAQIEDDRMLIRRDLVIAQMLQQLGAQMRDVRESFTPEHGAYHSHQRGTQGHGH
jgi:urease accessory protein